jgi:hypothetical protein
MQCRPKHAARFTHADRGREDDFARLHKLPAANTADPQRFIDLTILEGWKKKGF